LTNGAGEQIEVADNYGAVIQVLSEDKDKNKENVIKLKQKATSNVYRFILNAPHCG